MKHADEIIERILFFEGVPNMQRLNPVRVGETVPEQFQLDLELEYAAVKRLNDGIAACVAAGDNATRALLEKILVSEDDHIDWIETQQEAIRQLGDAHYLAQQLHD
jgi:bacterioferritin